ncbi:MAG: hypothetical protein CO186_07425 [Zetaproteobacteria bacterium CG_4_9_14_3_um_filter_49_83]|nr:MAG: hypothetical protein AUJ56_05805 [Zetaproteobacteria bacterium CG1_02_49_23]PIQ30735.1 MAG: hypothetical protein COW62_11495 [Zetaproteobacteria bacterium CG17_big_fil_post_rev_8_21_14_2_50_50_13]PIV30417.1 MAG: hypothetical protein COS35_06820 [Zetaproteobacteria bacterium CG02_land_8_20_14_3_00_50_9]PIY56858.1 MAG: hypothetical protein COZ00_02055 [Zetaproteobacteria bacterium CG_4_10_14_0_8_um_filter_49_80]PJA35132.1 MAG: hypothetical protein CO186_07425 [Zetaproteobacteria bacterium
MKRSIAFFVKHGVTVNLISIMMLLGGLYAALSIQREAFPSVNFDIIVVSAFYPGTSPKEVENLLLTPLEREIKSIDGIDKTYATAYAGTTQITIQVDPNYKDRSRLVSDIQQAINRADLPVDLPAAPVISEIKSEQAPVLSVTLFGDMDPLTLKRTTTLIKDDILNLPGVSHVFMQGDRKEEIRIELDPDRLRQHRVSINDVLALIRNWNINAPGGRLKDPQGQRIIRITGEFTSAEDAAGLVLRANDRGEALYLGDVATITDTLERPSRLVAAMGQPAVNFIVMKKGDADIIQLVDNVKSYLDTVPENYHVSVRTYSDLSLVTRLRLCVLSNNGIIGLGLVILVLLLFLRPAVAFTTAWGLPIIFFAGLGFLYISGVTLNLLTMFGFIIVLGLMVDDAIIIGENATWHMERGVSPEKAAIFGTTELLGPVTATVLTTIVAFLPLMNMDGIIGKFVFSIPVVVVVLLAFSWVEAIFILPNHIRDVARADIHPKERWLFRILSHSYTRVLTYAVRMRYLTVALTLLVLIATGMLASTMKFQLFPAGAESEFYLRVNAPVGTTLEEMFARLQAIDQEVRAKIDPDILETTTIVAGENSADQRESLKQIGDRFGFVRVILTPFTVRTVSAFDVMDAVEKGLSEKFPDLQISFAMQKNGPPVGRALQVEINGSGMDDKRQAAQRLIDVLAGIKGVYAIESDLEPGETEMHIVLDRARAAYAGIDLKTASQHIKAAFDGIRVSTLKQGKEEVDVTVRYPELSQRNIATLMQLEIPNLRGGLIPLSRVAHIEETPGSSSIRHKDGNAIINVSAEIDNKIITSAELNKIVKARSAEWLGDNPHLSFYLGGEQERSEESVRGLIFSFIFALIGIFVILAIQFNSISYPLLVMLAIPFGAIGIVVGFFLHGQPLSFMAMMGFVALTGVVVNASLVLAVFIQRQLKDGVDWFEAIIESGKRRLRAVLLTAITTVVGLLPTAYGWGGFDPFVAPMALALSWGLMFSTFITLFSIPASLAVGLDIQRVLHRHFKTRKPATP